MHDLRKKLPVVDANAMDDQRVVPGTTCFTVHAEAGVACMRERCPHWIPYEAGMNCVHVAAAERTHTLQEIGQIYGLTRMRICQIEKGIFEKIRAAG